MKDAGDPRAHRPQSGPRQIVAYGKYFLVKKLAEGGMAEIFLAKQTGAQGFERDLVIKRLLPNLCHVSDFVQMFLDEARLAARLMHPNIVQIHDLGVAGGTYFICMEYLAGEDLTSIIRRSRKAGQPVPVHIAGRIAQEVCDALHFAHTFTDQGKPLNIVHRDVSPSNILVSYAGGVKVLDFGIAKAETRLAKTTAGTIKGKYLYMSPEQALGDAIDHRADLFALGCTLYELLMGVRIFQRDSDLGILRAVLHDPIPPPRRYRPDVPEAFEAILLRALERDRDKRYESAAAMSAELGSFLSGTTSTTGGAQLATYLRGLFGAQTMEAKTQIPKLAALSSGGWNVPAEALDPTHVPDASVNLGEVPTIAATPGGEFGMEAVDRTAVAVAGRTRVAEAGEQAALLSATRRKFPGVAIGVVAGAVAVVGGTLLLTQLRRGPEMPVLTPLPAVAAPAPQPAPPPTVPPAPPPVAVVQPAPPAPAPTPAATPAPEPPRRLKPEDITGTVSRARARMMSCFQRNRASLSSDRGVVNLALTIASSGKVTTASASGDFGPGAISDCLIRESRALKFPRHLDREVKVSVPFEYELTR